MGSLRIGLAQINTTVGDLEGNLKLILSYIERARGTEADLLVFPELTITGYPPEDLLLQPSFIRANLKALKEIIPHTKGITAVVGFVDCDHDIYNAAAMLSDGQWVGTYRKVKLPNYGVFDEYRYFRPGGGYPIFTDGTVRIGVTICEDLWYPNGPIGVLALGGRADVIVNLSASPYHVARGVEREALPATRAMDYGVILAFCNLVGGQDELVFDGRSGLWNARGELIARAKPFEEDLLIAEVEVSQVLRRRLKIPRWRLDKTPAERPPIPEIRLPSPLIHRKASPAPKLRREPLLSGPEEVYRALVVGTRDYVHKNGFQKAVIGLSGGIDSSLVACIAVDALGKKNVIGVFMPSQYSSQESREDVQKLAKNLGIRLIEIPITELFESFRKALVPVFEKKAPDKTEENLQARIRGTLLMALSNKYGWLVLATGNKSEFSLGYATLYGDMAGGLAVLKDVSKTLVYELARWRCAQSSGTVIPKRVFERLPTAELRPEQTDEADLPAPYSLLDPILQAYVEEDRSLEEIVKQGFPEGVVRRVISLVNQNEYKRRQSPVGLKITPRALGKDRRFPITSRYHEESEGFE